MRCVLIVFVVCVIAVSFASPKTAPTWPTRYIWEFDVSFAGPMKDWVGYGYWYVDSDSNQWRLDEMMRVSVAVPGVPEPFPFTDHLAWQLGYFDGNTSCQGFPWFAWPAQILQSKMCTSLSPSHYQCQLSYNATTPITRLDITLDSHGFPLVADFTDLGETFTTTKFYAVDKFENNIMARPPICSPSQSAQEATTHPMWAGEQIAHTHMRRHPRRHAE